MSSPKKVQVKVEVGHQSICRDNRTTSGFTHDWTIFVRGADGADISFFIEKVVFLLHESFPKPRRVCKEPPYKVSESGYGSFTLPVEIYFRNKEEPRKCRLDYDLTLQLVGMPPLNYKKVEAMTFLNPSEDFEKKLLKGGAIILPSPTSPSTAGAVVKSEPGKISPASSNGSPSSTKKAHQHTPHTSKVKVKDSTLSQSVKRSGNTIDDVQKPKKKKTDKHENVGSNPGLKEISILSPALEGDIAKPKNVVNSVKKVKERRKSTDVANSVGSPKGAPKESKMRGKEMKVKKDKDKIKKEKFSPDANKEEPPKIQKFIFKRTADDAWSTLSNVPPASAPSSNSLNPVTMNNLTESVLPNTITTSGKQNERVSALLAEFAEDDSTSDDDMHIVLPEDVSKPKTDVTITSNTPADFVNGHHKPKKSKIHKPTASMNGKTIATKDEANKKNRTPNNDNSMKISPVEQSKFLSNGLSSNDLLEMHKKLNELQDPDFLQKIVDIVENSGTFEINSTNFEFDLCVLDPNTLNEIKHLVDAT